MEFFFQIYWVNIRFLCLKLQQRVRNVLLPLRKILNRPSLFETFEQNTNPFQRISRITILWAKFKADFINSKAGIITFTLYMWMLWLIWEERLVVILSVRLIWIPFIRERSYIELKILQSIINHQTILPLHLQWTDMQGIGSVNTIFGFNFVISGELKNLSCILMMEYNLDTTRLLKLQKLKWHFGLWSMDRRELSGIAISQKCRLILGRESRSGTLYQWPKPPNANTIPDIRMGINFPFWKYQHFILSKLGFWW